MKPIIGRDTGDEDQSQESCFVCGSSEGVRKQPLYVRVFLCQEHWGEHERLDRQKYAYIIDTTLDRMIASQNHGAKHGV